MNPSCAQFTVGKVDAGMAILLTEDNHLIEFPSLLLPEGVPSGAIIKIQVSRDLEEESRKLDEFWNLQSLIREEFGSKAPEPPKLSIQSVTQTSVVLSWEPLVLHTADLKQFQVFKNGVKTPHTLPTQSNMIKLSGLEMETNYEFYIVLVTSAGTYQSNTVQVQTHNIQNLSGIHVCMDPFLHASEVEELKKCCDRIDAKWTDEISIECTHLLCHQAQGPTFDMAVKLNVAVVKPEWLKACEALGKVQPIVSYYVDPNNK